MGWISVVVCGAIVAAAIHALFFASLAPQPDWPDVDPRDAVVVTGAHSGIGQAAALTLARQGFTVFCGVRKLQHLEEIHELAADAGGDNKDKIDTAQLQPLLLDVTQPDQIAAAVQTITDFVGERGLYGLFNNAGVIVTSLIGNSVEDMPLEDQRKVMEVNYFGTLAVTKAFLPLLRQRKGRIVMNSSVAGIFAGPFNSAYSASKFALEAMSDALRREVATFGVEVSVLEPGFVKTRILANYYNVKSLQGNSIYRPLEATTFRQQAKLALHGAPTTVTSEAVLHALRAPVPKPRYVVGFLAPTVRILSWLPYMWTDAIVSASMERTDNLSSDEELETLLQQTKQDVII